MFPPGRDTPPHTAYIIRKKPDSFLMELYLVAVLIAAGVSFTPRISYVPQMFTTIIHELGHAVSVVPFGGRLNGIKLKLTTAGEANVAIPRYSFPLYHIIRIMNLLAGYSAPVYLGLLLYIAVVNEWTLAIQVAFLVMSIVVLLFIRNWFGALVALCFLTVNALFLFIIPDMVLVYTVFVGSFLLIRGIIDICNVAKWTFNPSYKVESDFYIASQELFGSPKFWFVVFMIIHVPLMGLLSWMTVNLVVSSI